MVFNTVQMCHGYLFQPYILSGKNIREYIVDLYEIMQMQIVIVMNPFVYSLCHSSEPRSNYFL